MSTTFFCFGLVEREWVVRGGVWGVHALCRVVVCEKERLAETDSEWHRQKSITFLDDRHRDKD